MVQPADSKPGPPSGAGTPTGFVRAEMVEELFRCYGGSAGFRTLSFRLRIWRKKYAWLVLVGGAQLLKRCIDIAFREQPELDIQYIESQSMLTDFKILILTIPAVLTGRGAY